MDRFYKDPNKVAASIAWDYIYLHSRIHWVDGKMITKSITHKEAVTWALEDLDEQWPILKGRPDREQVMELLRRGKYRCGVWERGRFRGPFI
jgi:hypothetical protein